MADQEDTHNNEQNKEKEQSSALTFDPEKLFKDPIVLDAFHESFGKAMEEDDEFNYENLPAEVKRRVKALKKLQVEYLEMEGEFYQRVHELECEFMANFEAITARRKEIITGTSEPTDEECEWESDDEDDDDEKDDEQEDLSKKLAAKATMDDKVNGIPKFWLTAMKNTDLLSTVIQPIDEPILERLIDIRISYTSGDQPGFSLEFVFEPNEYFSNTTLTKYYVLRFAPTKDDPWSCDGPQIISSRGAKIDWKKGKNVTQKTIKKKQRSKGKGTRTVTQTVKNESFFNFFNQTPYSMDDEDMEEEVEEQMQMDFDIGNFLRNRLIPRGVLFFTGEAIEDEYEDEDDGEEEEEDENDETSDIDASHPPKNPKECQNQQQ